MPYFVAPGCQVVSDPHVNAGTPSVHHGALSFTRALYVITRVSIVQVLIIYKEVSCQASLSVYFSVETLAHTIQEFNLTIKRH